MTSNQLNSYRQTLLELRERVGGEVNYVVGAVHEDVNVKDVSSAPVHLADVAEQAVDAEVEVLHTTRSILDDINAALARIDERTFGKCQSCGAVISDERLKALPYTPFCLRCAKATEQSSVA
jgi:RNA polymerase-binding transcription factor DksA